MYIYVAGPYMPPRDLDPESPEAKEKVAQNIRKADEVAREIAKKGHIPFVPHTMMRGWEDRLGIPRTQIISLGTAWVKKCDALFFISKSPGADKERELAELLDMPIFESLDQIPLENSNIFSQQAFEGYLTEYKECMESYRHTYATLWQAGSVFAAISAGILALWGSKYGPIPLYVWSLAPLPIIFWYQGIFRPMDRYGELRINRLKAIEAKLNQLVPDLKMQHISDFSDERSQKETFPHEKKKKEITKWNVYFLKPRVKHSVHLLGLLLILFELTMIALLIVNYGSKIWD